MCVKYPQLHQEGGGWIRRKESRKPIHHLTRTSETPKTIPTATLSRRIITQNHPYLNNNKNNNNNQQQQQGPKSVSDLDFARIRKAVTAIAAKDEKLTSASEIQKHHELSAPIKVEDVEQQQPAAQPIKSDPGSGVDAFIAIMVHASKCK